MTDDRHQWPELRATEQAGEAFRIHRDLLQDTEVDPMAAIQRFYERHMWTLELPAGIRLNPEDVKRLREIQYPVPVDPVWASLAGIPYLEDEAVTPGYYRKLDGYRPYGLQHAFEAPSAATDDLADVQSRTGTSRPPDGLETISGDWDKPGPTHWCAGWALLLLAGAAGAAVIVLSAAVLTLLAMLGVIG